MLWLIIVLGFIGLPFVAAAAEPENYSSAIQHISSWIGPVNFWVVALNLIWLVPVLLYIPFYFRSIEYSVKAETGETMPEVYVKKGVLTITASMCPSEPSQTYTAGQGSLIDCLELGQST